MPWTPQSFRSKHNHGLSDSKAAHTARIANAILASENSRKKTTPGERAMTPEGLAIATANKWAQHHRRAAGGLLPRYQDGGAQASTTMTGAIGGNTPSATTASPMAQNVISRFNQMSPEQLQELVVRLQGANPQMAQMAQKVLQQKRMLPQATQQPMQQQAPQAATTPQTQAPQTATVPTLAPQQARGGKLPHRDMGGSMSFSMENPWWMRTDARDIARSSSPSGFLHSPIAGRTDQIRANPATDSYVIPADVVSGLGEGNSLAGARALQMSLSTGPHGTPLEPTGKPRSRYSEAPPPPHVYSQEKSSTIYDRGGRRDPGTVDCLLAGGEFIVTPEQVAALGHGDIKRGHRILDEFVVRSRKKIIDQMKKLPGPVGAKNTKSAKSKK